MSFLLIFYLTGIVGVGYMFARNVYRPGGIDGKGGPRKPGDFPERSIGAALLCWITYGAIWPLMVSLLALSLAIDYAPTAGGKLRAAADRLFGVKS